MPISAVSNKKIEDTYLQMVGLDLPQARTLNRISNIVSFALFCFAGALLFVHLPQYISGSAVIGAAGLSFLLQIGGGNLENRKIDLISHAIFTTMLLSLGCLGTLELLNNVQIALSVAAVLTLSSLFYCCVLRGIGASRAEKLNG